MPVELIVEVRWDGERPVKVCDGEAVFVGEGVPTVGVGCVGLLDSVLPLLVTVGGKDAVGVGEFRKMVVVWVGSPDCVRAM
jgi:hypothetical protein